MPDHEVKTMGTALESEAPEADARGQVDALIARYAWNSNDAVSAYEGWRYFISDEPEGAVAYVRRGGVLVANGDPICAPEHTVEILRRFAAFARTQRRACAFLGASERAREAAASLGFGAFKVGEEPVFDLTTYAPKGDRAKKARAARNQATRAGVTVREYCPAREPDTALEREIEDVLAQWLGTRSIEPMAFSLRVEPLHGAERKRYFLAMQEERIVAFVACSRLAGRDGAYIEDVIRRPDAPYGSTELLILHAFEELARSGVTMATLGVAPLQGIERQATRRHRVLGRLVAAARNHADRVYKFNSLNHYKKKFAPTVMEGSYLLYRPGRITPRLLLGLLGAFTPDGLGAYLRAKLPRPRPRRAATRAVAADTGTHPLRWLAGAGLMVSLFLLGLRHPVVFSGLELLRLHPLLLVPAAAGGAVYVGARARRQ
jgi:lysylphosphatidylglycerol synthetase-like protein (DUF2156 family)